LGVRSPVLLRRGRSTHGRLLNELKCYNSVMDQDDFRKRFSIAELSAIYADPESGGVLKKLLSKIDRGNMITEADEAVEVCRATFSENTDPLFFDREFLYCFLTTMLRENMIRSNFVDIHESVASGNPALAYCIYDHDHWTDVPEPIWLECAEDVGWDGVMPVEVLHRFNAGGTSRMVAYRDSPIWRRIGFAPLQYPEEKRELFPFVTDWKADFGVFSVEEREIRKMHVRVGLPDPIHEIAARVSRFPRSETHEVFSAKELDALRTISKDIEQLDREIKASDDAYVYGPDPASYDPPPPRQAPTRSYALDSVLREIEDSKRIIQKQTLSIREKSIAPVEKLRERYAAKLVKAGGDPTLAGALAAIENARAKYNGLLAVLDQSLERVLAGEKMVANDPMPTLLEKWAEYESRMYQRLQEVGSAHAAATEAYRDRSAVKDDLDNALRALGLKK